MHSVGLVKENKLIKMHGVSNFKIIPQLFNKFPAFYIPKIHHHVHNSLPPVPIPSQSIQTMPS
jgi:hypothetical protein